mmetsp:Transcript_70514/g.228366  ORF Transcript_70514/g.228366 Transcript_70514/m.228366 type:complete len:242 (-) Transcript_70514:312-1037(-)
MRSSRQPSPATAQLCCENQPSPRWKSRHCTVSRPVGSSKPESRNLLRPVRVARSTSAAPSTTSVVFAPKSVVSTTVSTLPSQVMLKSVLIASTKSTANLGTPRPRRKPASSCCLTQPSASPSMATKRLSRCPSSEAGSCVAARTAMARHQRRFSRSCFRARTCSCVRLMAAAPRSSVNQGIWRHSCAPGRRRSSKLSAARTSCCAPGLAAWICSMGGPARWACRRPPTPKASPSVGTGAKG